MDSLVHNTRGLEVFVPAEATSILSGSGRGYVLDIFILYTMVAPWEVRTQIALNSDHFPVTSRIIEDPSRVRVISRINRNRFKVRTEAIGVGRDLVAWGRLSDLTKMFTRDVQKILEFTP